MRPSVVFVDCYGTLVEGDRPAIEAVLGNIVRRTGVEGRSLDRLWWQRFRQLCATSGGQAFETQRALERRAMVDTLAALAVSVPSDQVADLLEPLFRYWRTARPLPDALALLRHWRLCPVVIVSNIDRADLEHLLPSLPAVAGVVTSQDARGYKPAPSVFRHALALGGYAPQRVVHVGDSWESDVEGALLAGITPVWLNRTGAVAPASEVARIASFDELASCLNRLPDPDFTRPGAVAADPGEGVHG